MDLATASASLSGTLAATPSALLQPGLWNQALVWPILNLLIAFYKLFEALHIPGPLGFAIILLTITIRGILYPLTNAQLISARKMAKIKPHMDELQKKHKNDKQALQQAQMALYKEHGVNPAAGCLPLLIQMPILFALYRVFYQVLPVAGPGGTAQANIPKLISDINHILYHPILKLSTLDIHFFGISLAAKPSEWQTYGVWLLAIPVITAILQWYQTKQMMGGQTPVVSGQLPEEKKKKEITKDGKDKKDEKPREDMSQEMQKQMAIISPLMFGFFAYQFPIGLALYWNIFGLFGIMQQQFINKRHG